MSRVGKKPISIPEGVEVKLEPPFITVKGLKGELKQEIHPRVKLCQEDRKIIVSVENPEDKRQWALWGLFRSLIFNMVEGVTKGFEKKLEINGIGYKSSLSGNKLILNVGFSHPVEFELPKVIKASVEKNIITISGIDKQLVGSMVSQIRSIRKPEPYKGKGIRYVDEVIRRKVGKALKGESTTK